VKNNDAEKIDVHGMAEMIRSVPNQLAEVAGYAAKVELDINPENIVVCGMGGSAIAGDILSAYIDPFIDLPVYVHRDYGLPKEASDGSLVIISSYSGNTEEAVSAYEAALERGLTVVGVTTGGTLGASFQEKGTPWVEIPKTGLPPRLAYGFSFAAMAKVLSDSGIISPVDAHLQNAATELNKMNSDESERAELEDHGRRLALLLKDKFPVVYASRKMEFVAYSWKTKFNENAKVFAYHHCFPELNHNEINGYGDVSEGVQRHFVFIKDRHDDPEVIRRMKVTMELLEKNQAGAYSLVELGHDDIMTRLFEGCLIGDWATYYLALERGIDPTPVAMIEDFKKALGESRA